MGSSYNRVILLGNVTRDIELRYLQNGTAVADIGMAINEKVKRNEQWVDEPCFVEASCFGRTAEVANEYLSKGAPLFIEGRLRFSQWEKDGQKRSKLSVVVDKLQLIGSKPSTQQSQSSFQQQAEQSFDAAPESDPFGDEIQF